MKKYYVAQSYDPAGHSPTQEQITAGLKSFQQFPSTFSYNTACWQPHLENEHLVKRIWEWLEHYRVSRVNFKSMSLATKQVWWLIVPESLKTESELNEYGAEQILTRQDLKLRVENPSSFFDNIDSRNLFRHPVLRDILPRTYMQVHAMMDYMYKEGFYPTMFNHVSTQALEFNAEFGKYFNNNPVIPLVFSTYYSKPRCVKTHANNRQHISNDNDSIIKPTPYPPKQGDKPPCYWFTDDKLGAELTAEEKDKELPHRQRFDFPANSKLNLELKLDQELF